MSTRGKEYKQNRKDDKDGNLVPVSKIQMVLVAISVQMLLDGITTYLKALS